MNNAGNDQPKRSFSPFSARVMRVPDGGLVSLLGDGRARDCVDLATGTPRAPEPNDGLVEAACAALRAGAHQYENPAGNSELRAKIANSFATPADPDTEITVTVGGTEALHVALTSIVDPGDEIVVFEPFYDNFIGAIALAGARPRFVRLHAPEWRFDPDELASAFGPRTKAILLNTPHNPTGRIFDGSELSTIAELCAEWNTTVISDEVYSAYTFDGRTHISVADLPALAERSVVVGSLSKSHALSGWRIGFLRAPSAYTTVLRKAHISITGGAAAPLQRAVLDSGVLEPGRWQPALELQHARDRVLEMFSEIGLVCTKAEGGCYILADVGLATSGNCDSYVELLQDKAGVLIIPGTLLFADQRRGERLVRIAFNKSNAILDDAAQRISRNIRSPRSGSLNYVEIGGQL